MIIIFPLDSCTDFKTGIFRQAMLGLIILIAQDAYTTAKATDVYRTLEICA
jgi:hypothetical protein